MKKMSSIALAAAIVVSMAAPVFAAEEAPYFGNETHNGNYWNGPKPSQQFGREMDVSAFAKAHCHAIRSGEPFGIGTRRVCD
jgi:hypothetical protein